MIHKCLFTLFIAIFTCGTVQAEPIYIEVKSEPWDRESSSTGFSVITSDEINRPAVIEALEHEPGLQVNRSGPLGQLSTLFIRGARSESTLVLIDGIEVNDVSSPSQGFDFGTLTTSNVDRIEILRGPQSVRYGSGALGGVVDIKTRRPEQNKKQLRYALELGSFSTTRGALSASAGNEKFGSTVSLEGVTSKGFSSAADGEEDDGIKTYTASSSLYFQPSDLSEATLLFRYSKSKLDLDRQGGPEGDDPNYLGENDELLSGFSVQQRSLNRKLKTTLSGSFTNSERDLANSVDPLNSDESEAEFDGRSFNLNLGNEFYIGEFHTINSSIRARSESAEVSDTIAGVATSLKPDSRNTLGSSATYTYNNASWKFESGVSIDRHILNRTISLDRNFETISSRLSVRYGEGFKLPSLYQLYSSYGDRRLKHETGSAIDADYTQEISQNLNFAVAGFYGKFRNLIDFDTGTNRYANISRAQTRGLETRAAWTLPRELKFEASYSYLDAIDEVTRFRLLRRAPHSGAVTLSRRISKYEMIVRGRLIGKRDDWDPATFMRKSNSGFNVWGLTFNVDLPHRLTLSSRIENLFDQRYEEVLGYATAGTSVYVGLRGEI